MSASALRSTVDGCRRWCGLGLLLAVLAGAGCAPEPVGGVAQPVPPDGVLSREDFVRVLAEIQLVEAAADQRYFRNDHERQRIAEAYNDVWHRTGIQPDVFDASYTWWWEHPEAMKAVLRDVVDALKDLEVESNRKAGERTEGNLKNRVAGDTPAPSTE